jgi:hypothetical protein
MYQGYHVHSRCCAFVDGHVRRRRGEDSGGGECDESSAEFHDDSFEEVRGETSVE